VAVNHEIATEWFRKAALKGHVESVFNMGVAFEKGQGVEVNYASAADWYRKAASQGHVTSMIYLGDLLSEGHPGVEQDYQAAIDLYGEAIDRGSVKAVWSMGLLHYDKGNDVLGENMTAAFSYWQRAADLGHAGAAHNIGYAYWNGTGGYEQNSKLAKKYTKVAATQGQEAAIAHLNEMTACAQCGTGSAPGVCAGCKQVHYCNKDCQLQHWRSTHMPHCSTTSPATAKEKSNRACASCGAHNATKLCSDCRYEGDPRRKVR